MSGCPMSGCGHMAPGCQDKPRKDSSIAVSVEHKGRLIEEAAAAGMNLKDYLAKILCSYWGIES